jgi:hypothetical protein
MAEEGRREYAHGEALTLLGPFWFAGWLFTIGIAHLPFWKVIVGIVIWPYFLGAALG